MFSRARARISGRYALATAAVVLVGLPAGALASGEGRSLIAGQRNPSSGSLTRETQIISNNGTYSTRQSNKGSGGGAIYGCRAAVGNEPCIRANNLTQGRAFEFETNGKEAGQITVKDTTGVPFTTNATGNVKNLNADRLDDKDASDFAGAGDLLFAAVNADGSLVAGSRGATSSSKAAGASQTYTVVFGRDVSKCSYTASAVGGSSNFGFGVQPAAGNANAVAVDEPADAGTPAGTGRAFHLQVIC
jgi:hypothetical protein